MSHSHFKDEFATNFLWLFLPFLIASLTLAPASAFSFVDSDENHNNTRHPIRITTIGKVQKSTVSFDLLLVTSSQPSRYLQNVTAQSFVMFIFAQKRPCENRGRKKWKSTETLKRTPSVMHSKIHSGYKQLCGGQTIDCYFTDTVWSDMLHMVVPKSWNLHQEWHHSFFNALTLAMWATTQRVLCIHHTENEHSGSGR